MVINIQGSVKTVSVLDLYHNELQIPVFDFWCDTKCLFSNAEEYAEIGCEKVTLSSFSKD